MNLTKISLDKLEELPMYLPRNYEFSGKLNVRYNDHDGYYRRRYLNNCYSKIRATIKSMNGKHYNEILIKLVSIWPKDCRKSVKEYLDSEDKIVSNSLGIWRNIGRGSLVKSLTKRHWFSYRNPYDEYFDQNLIYNVIHPKEKRISKYSNPTYIPYSWNKKLQQQIAKEDSKIEIKFINNSILHKFYIGLLNNRNSLLNLIDPVLDKEPEMEFTRMKWHSGRGQIEVPIDNTHFVHIIKMKDFRRTQERKKRDSEKARLDLELVKLEINKLINGDLSSFYRSKTYLYSLNKDCHHFEQP